MGAQLVVGILTPAVSLLFAMVFYVFWRNRPDLHYVKQFSVSYIVFGLGFVQTSIIPSSLASLSIWLSSCLALLSLLFGCKAFLSRHDLQTPNRLLNLYWMLATAGAFVASVIYENAMLLALISCTVGSAMLFTISFKLRTIENKSVVDWYVPRVLFVTGAAMLSHSVYIILQKPYIDIALFTLSQTWIVVNMVVIMQCCAVAVAITMFFVSDSLTMASDRAMKDELSGLQRRERFEELAFETLDKAKRSGVPVSLVVCDLDHFKIINDTYGHLAGDEVIKAFGAIMRQTARSTDVLGRIGGEEFALFLWNTDQTGAKLFSQQLRSALSNLDLSEVIGDRNCTASFGISQWNGTDDYRELFALSDKALYHAKHSGRDCVKIAQATAPLAA